MTPELTIILAGIRPHNWVRLYDSIAPSMGDHTFELIAIGPYDPPQALLEKPDFRFIRDFSCPTRCTMMAALAAKAPLITWMADDGYYYPNALRDAIELWSGNPKEVINLMYREGPAFQGPDKPREYWTCHYHGSLAKLPGILPHYKLLLMGMINKQYFYDIGGLDCRYEYLNLNLHDLGIRIQNDGGGITLSNSIVLTVDWVSDQDRLDEYGRQDATIRAFYENDWGIYSAEYATPQNNRIKIPYDNWLDAPPIWGRRKFNNINQYICQ